MCNFTHELFSAYPRKDTVKKKKKEESSLETGMAKFSFVFFQVSSHKHLKGSRWINLLLELIHKSEIFS